MEIDGLTVTSRWADVPVYRLAGCSQFWFNPPGSERARFDRVWKVAADAIGLFDEATDWMGPLDTRSRRFRGGPEAMIGAMREAIDRDRDEATCGGDAVTLRVWSAPNPPRQQLSLVLPEPGSREPFASLITGERPSLFLQQPELVVERVRRQAEALRPHDATVGFALMSETWMEPHHVDSAWPYLERHPGLQLPYAQERGADGAGIPNIDWLTVLGQGPLKLLGGTGELRRRLDEAAGELGAPLPQLIEYDGGAIVRASETPHLGDSEAGGAPTGYRVVDAALRGLRWDGRSLRPNSLLKVSEKANGISRAEATRRWAARFE